MITFKWYDAGEEGKKESEFSAEEEDIVSLITSITAYVDNISKLICSKKADPDLDKTAIREIVKAVMIAAFEAGMEKAVGKEEEENNDEI